MNGKERVTFAGFGVVFFAIFIIYYYFCLWGGWVDISIFTATLLTQALLFKKVPIDTQMYCVCLVTQSCLILCDPMDFSPPGSSVLGILQARILEWVVFPFSKGSSRPRIELASITSPALAAGSLSLTPSRKPCCCC